MRRNIFTMACAVSAVALLAFTSCNKEEVAQSGEFTATIETAAKTAINIDATGAGVMTWNQNDQIAIFSTTPTTPVTYYAENSGATSTFRRVNGEDEVPNGDNYYAVYPAGIATSANNVVTLSPTQTYSASAFEAPMYAQSESHDLPFKNLCAVLHLVVSDAVSSVAVNTPNEACTGSYTVTWNNGNPTGSITANSGNTVTLSGIASTARNLYIYLPPTTYTAMTITIVPANGGSTIVKTLNQNFTMARNTYYTITVTVPPTGAISGLFSVSSDQQVFFSQGNLQFRAANTREWRFAEHQYDFVGNGSTFGNVSGSSNDDASETYTGWIDLFAWGTSGYNHGATNYQPWQFGSTGGTLGHEYLAYGNAANNLNSSPGTADWGYNAISNGGNTENSGWRTLTNTEWAYLFSGRITDGKTTYSYAKARVAQENGTYVKGIVLFPDNFTPTSAMERHPFVFTGNNATVNNLSAQGWSNTNAISYEQWTTLYEPAGVVFLPAAGYRIGTNNTNTTDNGYYWSSIGYTSSNAYRAHNLSVGVTDAAGVVANNPRSNSCAVRLVKNYTPASK